MFERASKVWNAVLTLAFLIALSAAGAQVVRASGNCMVGSPLYCFTRCDYLCEFGPGVCDKSTHCCVCPEEQ